MKDRDLRDKTMSIKSLQTERKGLFLSLLNDFFLSALTI